MPKMNYNKALDLENLRNLSWINVSKDRWWCLLLDDVDYIWKAESSEIHVWDFALKLILPCVET